MIMKIKEFIRKRRKDLGLSMEDVADACGVTKATVSRWESGDIANIKSNKIKALADVLQVRPSVLIEDEIGPSVKVPGFIDFAEELGLDSNESFICYIKNLGYSVQSDTNGYQISYENKSIVVSAEEFEQMKKELSDYMFFNIWNKRIIMKKQ